MAGMTHGGGKHWTEEQRKNALKTVTIRYDRGESVRDIATALGVSYGKAHRLVEESGATMRPRGGPNRKGK